MSATLDHFHFPIVHQASGEIIKTFAEFIKPMSIKDLRELNEMIEDQIMKKIVGGL